MIIMSNKVLGFTLVEMAIVLVVIGLILGGLLAPLTSQRDMLSYSTTHQRLEEVKEALIGFAITNGRLPCPASSTSNGLEDPVGGGVCNHNYDGFVPSVTLGLASVDNNGYSLDGWGGAPSNRIRYAVSKNALGTIPNAFTSSPPSSMKNQGMAALKPDLYICASSIGINGTDCNTAIFLTGSALPGSGVPAVIYSLGKNAATGGIGPGDEAANLDNDPVFISHEPRPSGATGGEFDDIVTWISPSILYSRMVQAGQLP
jgi:type II secretory pathway pseudopilin PulG